jgi:O-antigen/teichoic acid export membrane protein
MQKAAIRYAKFPLLSTGSTLINIAGYAVPTLLIAAWYGPTVAGWLALAERVTWAPFVLIGLAVTQVFGATAAKLARTNPTALPSFFARTAGMLVVPGLIPSLLLGVAGPSLFSSLFGSEWEEAGEYARMLAVASVFPFIAGGLTQTLNILERQSLQLAWDALRMLITCGVMYGVYLAQCSARCAILAYVLSLLITYVALLLLAYLAVLQHAQRNRPAEAQSVDGTLSG